MEREDWREGERRAAAFLESEGFTVLEKNFRDRRGEVDIVALRRDELIFVEVKSWRRLPFADLEYSIDRKKIRTIVRESRRYLSEHPEYRKLYVRYDLIFIEVETGRVEHIPAAFTESGAA